MFLALHSAMGEGHSCSTSIWQVYPLTAGFPFPVCAALTMGWATSSESWETLNAISRNSTASQKPWVPVFSPLWCLSVQWDTHIIWFCYSLGHLVSLLGVHYVWTKGRSQDKTNGWSVLDSITRSTKSHVPLHSWILFGTPGAVPLQIRGKWTTKKQKPCLPSCKQHQEPQSADYSAGIHVGILFLVMTNWSIYNLYIIPSPKDKIIK